MEDDRPFMAKPRCLTTVSGRPEADFHAPRNRTFGEAPAPELGLRQAFAASHPTNHETEPIACPME
jgi:hypothetical protein